HPISEGFIEFAIDFDTPQDFSAYKRIGFAVNFDDTNVHCDSYMKDALDNYSGISFYNSSGNPNVEMTLNGSERIYWIPLEDYYFKRINRTAVKSLYFTIGVQPFAQKSSFKV